MSSIAAPTCRWGILSTASIATKVRRAIGLSNTGQAQAVASRSFARAENWAREHGIERYYGDYQQLLDDPNIDAVYIGLPPSMHCEWTIKAAEAGKHVLCEKPLALNFNQAEQMAAACREHDVLLMDGVMWVHHERTSAMQQHISPHWLGEIKRVTSAFCFRMDEDRMADDIRLNAALGGGCLGDLGWYCARVSWWALSGAMPERVFATARWHQGVTYNLSALMWYDQGRMASFDCGFDLGMRQWVEVAGSERSLVCDDFVLPHSEKRARWWIHEPDGHSQQHVVDNCCQEAAMIEHFSWHVNNQMPNKHWIGEALLTQKICDALDRSARSERIIELEP